MTGWLPPPEIPIEIIYIAINSIRRDSGPGSENDRGNFL